MLCTFPIFVLRLLKDLMLISGLGMCGFVAYKHFMNHRAMLEERKRREVKKQKSVEEIKNSTVTEEESRENAINNNISASNQITIIPLNSNNNTNNTTNNLTRNIERLPPISAYGSRPQTVPPGVA